MTGLVGLVIVLGFGAACDEASAQRRRDSLAPVSCFEHADNAQLAEQSAIQLCAGVPSDAPGRCYAAGVDTYHELATQKLLRLCTAATSLQPLDCYAGLSAEGQLTEDQIVSYCTTTCPESPPPPQASNPACLQQALDRTELALQQAGELCQASSSAGPVDCYLAGEALHTISDSSLVQLCAEVVRCQYYYTTTPGY